VRRQGWTGAFSDHSGVNVFLLNLLPQVVTKTLVFPHFGHWTFLDIRQLLFLIFWKDSFTFVEGTDVRAQSYREFFEIEEFGFTESSFVVADLHRVDSTLSCQLFYRHPRLLPHGS
jgi:hypothetical protein